MPMSDSRSSVALSGVGIGHRPRSASRLGSHEIEQEEPSSSEDDAAGGEPGQLPAREMRRRKPAEKKNAEKSASDARRALTSRLEQSVPCFACMRGFGEPKKAGFATSKTLRMLVVGLAVTCLCGFAPQHLSGFATFGKAAMSRLPELLVSNLLGSAPSPEAATTSLSGGGTPAAIGRLPEQKRIFLGAVGAELGVHKGFAGIDVHRNKSGHAPHTRLSHGEGRLHESTNLTGRSGARGIHHSINATALVDADAYVSEATEAKELKVWTPREFLASVERELAAAASAGPWPNRTTNHLHVRRVEVKSGDHGLMVKYVELKSGEQEGDWFLARGVSVHPWMLENPSIDKKYNKVYRSKEVFKKSRFSENALRTLRTNKWYLATADAIHLQRPIRLGGGGGRNAWAPLAMFRNAIIHLDGDVQTQDYFMASAGCGPKDRPISNFHAPNFDIVVSIAQFWGFGYYHFVHENLVRLPLLLDVTAKFKQAMVQVHKRNKYTLEMIESFGVPRNRIFSGRATARILLVPQPVSCGHPSAMLLRILRQTALRTTLKHLVSKNEEVHPSCRMLVVDRGKKARSVRNHDAMMTAIQDAHPECHLAAHTGKEPLKNQLEMFRGSTAIIGPHGAGLASMYISRPGTDLLEFLTAKNVNLCNMMAAANLGLRYWALSFPGSMHGSPMTADIREVLATVKAMVETHGTKA